MGDACHIKALDVAGIGGAIAVDGIVDGAFVAFLKHGYVHHLHLLFLFGLHTLGFANEHFVLHTRHLVGAIAVEDDDIVDGRAVLDKLVLFETGAHKAVFAVDVEFFGCLNHLGGLDVVE